MKIKWIYWTIALLMVLSLATYNEMVPFHEKNWNFMWGMLAFLGVLIVVMYCGFAFENTKLYKHFHKKITIQIK